MKDRRKRCNVVSWSVFFWCTLFVVFSSILFTTLNFTPFRHSHLLKWQASTIEWQTPTIQSKSDNAPTIRQIVMLLDQAIIFLHYPPSFHFYTKHDLQCVYISIDSGPFKPQRTHPPIQLYFAQFHEQIIRCPLPEHGFNISILIKSEHVVQTKNSSIHQWNPLVYEALLDFDNTTILFVKGLNLRPERLSQHSRFECLYGLDFTKPKFYLKSDAICAAQEIIRCTTPKSILNGKAQIQAQSHGPGETHSIKVSINVRDKGITFPSIARTWLRSQLNVPKKKSHGICVCTMLRNQARFMKEWIMYHTRIGVERWFIYDNNSDDEIENVIALLQSVGYNITQHLWPWVKSQEAGFAHCALRARALCEWVGFIDVDEFFNVKIKGGLHRVIWHYAKPRQNVGEIRIPCYSFGPSGLREMPREGVMVGYTCRLRAPERHKSIVRPEALNQSLINVVHHFHLSKPFMAVDAEKNVMIINHYKYQVWEVFKEKFYRRVATYVANWQDDQNVGSKDRVAGLGTKAIEPADWADRFCEVKDMELRDWVLKNFVDRRTQLLPWQPEFHHHLKKKRRGKEKNTLIP